MPTRRCTWPSRPARTLFVFTAPDPRPTSRRCSLAPQFAISVLYIPAQLFALLGRHLALLGPGLGTLVLVDVAHVLAHAVALVLAHALVLAAGAARLAVAVALRHCGA